MDEENDILFTNVFIKEPELVDKVRLSGTDYSKEFEDFYITQRKSLVEPSIKSIPEERINVTGSIDRYQRFVKTLVSIDSRNRDTVLYPKASDFKIFLGRTFYNVRSVRIVTMEFPNTNAVINSTNNKIYWLNQEDIDLNVIDTVTKTYPIYSSELRIGSYIAPKLEVEMESKFRLIKRRNKTGDFHYFTANLDIETDVVTFTSLIIKQLGINPLKTLASAGVIEVTALAHGYYTGETIYMIGSRVVSGIGSNFLNQPHVISVINADKFSYEITEKAIDTAEGGGSNIKTGRLAPFQLLFGTNSGTVANNIGYLYENSSTQVIVNIKSMDNFYQVQVKTLLPHGLLKAGSINTTVSISGTGTTPVTDGTKVISDVLDTYTFLISVGSLLTIPSLNQGAVTIGANTFDIVSVSNFGTKVTLVETFNKHNYELQDIGNELSLYSTISRPSFDGVNTIYGVLTDTQLLLNGEILDGGNVSVVTLGDGGYTPMHEPLLSEYYVITSMAPGVFTSITIEGAHKLKIGDKIKFYNTITSPDISNMGEGVHVVNTITNTQTFTIDFETTSISSDFTLREACIGSSIVTMSFPTHGFNTVTSITQVTFPVGITPGVVKIQTLLAHNLTTGDTIRISNSNSAPSIDDGGYVVTVIDDDEFTILFPLSITTVGTYASIGMNMDFLLYRVKEFAGFDQALLNNVMFKVRDIIDTDTFTFDINGYYSKSKSIGGGTGIFISSLLHGFNGVQTNTKNGLIDRSISLEGENYAFLTCPQLGTMKNTGNVSDIFARITLDQSPGMMVFNFLSTPKEFNDAPLDRLETLQFSMVNFDNTFYEFNDLDYSMTLEIVETIDSNHAFNISSRRGISDTLNNHK